MREGKALVKAFLLKRRLLRRPGNELRKGLTQVDDRHLRGIFRHVQHPGELFALEGIELGLSQKAVPSLGK
jgi:hypothetical protein